MSNNDSEFIWIKEPIIVDETYASYDESTIDWLRRSTNKRATDSRIFLNHNLGKIPKQYRELIIDRLTQDWRSGLFELILARYLQELGANLLYEKPIQGGKRPDFTTVFDDGSIIVEAISPIFNSELIKEQKNNAPLIKYIEKNKPPGWLVLLLRLPNIGPSDSKKEFQKKIDYIFENVRSTSENKLSISETTTFGEIALECTRTKEDYKRIGGGPILTSWDDTEERIKHALNKKRPQVREANIPVILAINTSGISSEIEDFNQALYGHSVDVIDVRNLRKRDSYFKEDGLFTRKKSIDPTYAGIFACFNYGLAGGPPPILFHNPNYVDYLPKALLQLKQRNYNFDSQSIVKENLKNSELLSKLRFPPH